jgi:molecular chaperone DnaK (HSP70)
MKVKVDNSFIKRELSIESLIVLQMLNIKLDAEIQIGNIVSSAVLTLPTHYNLRQRNAFRDAAKIAGLENVQILSEISAAAIDYANYMKRIGNKNTNTVFFLSLDELECDAAVCSISEEKIEYKSYCNQNLSSHIHNDSILKEMMKGVKNFLGLSKEKTQDEKFLKVLKDLFDKTLQTAIKEPKDIDSIVIAGNSCLMNFIKEWTAKYFDENSFYCCDPLEVIINGSAIFSQIFGPKKYDLKISEVSFYPLFLQIIEKYPPNGGKRLVLDKNKLLPLNMVCVYGTPKSYNPPLKISVFQDETPVLLFNIDSMPQSNYYDPWITNKIRVTFNNFGEIQLNSKLLTNDTKTSVNLALNETKLGLKELEIIEEQKIVTSIEQILKKKYEISEMNSAIKQSKDDLEKYYIEIKKSVDNNSALRGLKKNRIDALLGETFKVIQSNSCDLKSIANQKKKLEETVSCLKL